MHNNDGICYIIGACQEFCNNISISPSDKDLVIAADGGYDLLKKLNIEPNILLGDFDSILDLPLGGNIIRYPSKKDDTDTFLAYKEGLNKGYRNFIIVGGIGGRIDHTVANLQTLSNIAENGGRGFLITDNTVLTVIRSSKLEFDLVNSGYISVFAIGKKAENVSIEGLKYCADKIELHPDTPLGVSNEFIGKRASISVEKGNLLVIWNTNINDFFKTINSYLLKQ